jgi:hypothetical protein
MIPGANYVYQCPECGSFITKGSLRSGNTFGSRLFSDGKVIAPMLPDFPDLTKCKKCNTIFWLSKLKEIGTFEWGEDRNPEWQNADVAQFLEIDDYFNAIKMGIAENKEQELIIRQQIWWAYNDRSRMGQKIFNDENDELRWIENVEKLKSILNQSDINQKIMVAEINRNLGDFENCIHIIQSIDDEDLDWVKERLIKECKLKNKRVVELS